MAAPFNPFDPRGAESASGSSGFPGGGNAAGTNGPLAVASPPTVYLWIAAGLALAGIGATILNRVALHVPSLTVVGWTLAGPLSIGMIGYFMAEDTKRRAAPLYVEPTWLKTATWATAAAAAVGTVAGSLAVADWLGHW